MAERTLTWRDEKLTTTMTDAEAATVCERIPADSKSRQYALSLVADLRRYGSLFPNKLFWLHSLALGQLDNEMVKSDDPAAVPSNASGHLPRIAAFLTPASKHLKSGARVTFTSGALTVCIRRASEKSRWPGHFYVLGLTGFGETGEASIYAGRISPEGWWFPSGACETSINALLDEFEQDPAGYAAAYGQRTGRCCFCLIPLDDPISIGLGYGPKCARHYSLPWGKRALAKATAVQCEKPGGEQPAA